MDLKLFFRLGKKAVNAWLDDYAPSMGAAIAYYTVFSIAPLLIIVIAVAGLVWGRDAVQGQIFGQIAALVGVEPAHALEGLMRSVDKPVQGLTATVVGVAVLVIGATSVFSELQNALDRIWKVPPAQKRSGIWNFVRTRLLSLGLVLGLAFLLLVSLVVSAGISALGQWSSAMVPEWEVLLQVLNTLVSLLISTVLFGAIFRFMPQAIVTWRDVRVGAAVTAVLFELGKFLIGLYLGKSATVSSFAAAGSIVVVLLWVYYAAQVFLLGAEFTWVYATERHSSLDAGSRTAAPDASLAAGDPGRQG